MSPHFAHDAPASPRMCVYTSANQPICHQLSPLFLEKLGRRDSGSDNRLITSLPLLDWAGLHAPHETGQGKRNKNAPRDQGSNDAEKM